MKKIVFLIVVVLNLIMVFNGVCLAADLKVATVDMEKVFNAYDRTKKDDASLKQEQKQKEEEGQNRLNEINKLKDEALLLRDEAKNKKEEEIKTKLQDLQAFGEKSRFELLRKRELLWKQIVDEIKLVIDKEAKDKKYDLVLDDKALLYGNAKFDITERIIELMNDKYKKENK